MVNTTASPPTETTNLLHLARESLAACDGAWQPAAMLLEQRITEDSSLFRALMMPLVRTAVWALIRRAAHGKRRETWLGPSTAGTDKGADGLKLAGDRHASNLLAFTLRGGRRLADATRAEVEASASWYLTLARTNGIRGRWLLLVAQAMEDAPTVAAALDNNGLLRLREEAEA